MSLASIIRLEFAYPGVGVLAGDSIQYLSIATAHGVIMVFYMIMPVVFGAFGNFLLPTQLGVHDVAFPRLNSAAFWFLPGGLIMLCQLVCVDRRYQRMNCFNIRELQGILKRKFFTDLINSNDHRQLLDKSIIGLRFKNNSNFGEQADMSLFYNFGTTTAAKDKSSLLSNGYSTTLLDKSVLSYFIPTSVSSLFITIRDMSVTTSLTSSMFNLVSLLKTVFFLPNALHFTSVTTFSFIPSFITDFIAANSPSQYVNNSAATQYTHTNPSNASEVQFNSENIEGVAEFSSSMSEFSNSLRFTRFNNPLISYDYKCGNYLGI